MAVDLCPRDGAPGNVGGWFQAITGQVCATSSDTKNAVRRNLCTIAPRIGAAPEVEEKCRIGMKKKNHGLPAAHLRNYVSRCLERKKIKAVTSRKPEVSASLWNDLYPQVDEQSRLKWLEPFS